MHEERDRLAAIPHDPPCPYCGCGYHHWLNCECGCTRHDRPGD